jgi:hypothetical protein
MASRPQAKAATPYQAADGESIGILNIQSKKTLQATVAGPGKVSIAAPIPGPLAANTAAQAANR